MSRYTLKKSTVFVSVGAETKVFHSVDEVPPEWVRRFDRAKSGIRPQTILIADQKGREEILRALQGLPSSVRPRWTTASLRQTHPRVGRGRGMQWSQAQVLVEAAIAALIGTAIALAFWIR